MIRLLILFTLMFLTGKTYAHSVTKVYYKIEQYNDHISIIVDLPWTIKYELETFDEILKERKDRLTFNAVLKRYVSTHFSLWSSFKKEIPLKTIEEIPQKNAHVHGVLYQFIFEKETISRVKNTMLFHTNKDQTNVNSIKVNGKWKDYITSSEAPEFELKNTLVLKPWILALVFAIISFFVFKIIMKKPFK